MKTSDPLTMFVVYSRPVDYPESVVVRRVQVLATGETVFDAEPLVVCASLAEARAVLPPGLVRFHRDPSDPTAIVETWL